MVITPDEASRLDRASAESIGVLMERAGFGLAREAVRMGVGYGSRVSVLAGVGNNGGDGYVAARWLARRGALVTVFALGQPKSEAAAAARDAAAPFVRFDEFGQMDMKADLVVDAVFGSGFRDELPDAVEPWIDHSAPVLAVDVPSGLNALDGSAANAAFRAQRTVTFHALKPGHLIGVGPEHCGEITVHDIGLVGGDAEFVVCEDSDVALPKRDRPSHKWSVGSVLVVGGVPGLAGAALLAARSAMASGAGAVGIVALDEVQSNYALSDPGLLTYPIAGDRYGPAEALAVLRHADRFDVLVVGPGLGGDVYAFVSQLLAEWPGVIVLDADGLNAVAAPNALASRPGRLIVTPHAGEFRRLTGREPSYLEAMALASQTGATVVLKGNPTFVAGDELWAVTSGGPELATIGTGDVLAGAIAAAAARGLPPDAAARAASHWHGRAGEWLSKRTTVTAP
ncbi:MAG: NAD(P)H-hydrate dehydratase [Acidimicrobiia bacterium]|nr:NAD(P)H-hydrate dehydratase [Acidimicrobiia bacterium]